MSAAPRNVTACGNGLHEGHECVATTHAGDRDRRHADAQRLALCWNTHDELVASLRAGIELVDAFLAHEVCDHAANICFCTARADLRDMRAVLAKATA